MKNQNENYIQKITEILRIGGRSERTILNYTCAINRFLKYFSDINDISQLNESDVLEYIKNAYLVNGSSENTYNMNIYAIKYFYCICFNKEFNNKLLPHSKRI
jgi:site-specific recombinase XerD